MLTEAISAVLATNPETNLLDIEQVFRDAGSPVYLIAKPELTIVFGMPAWRSALDRLGMSPQENRYALTGTTAISHRTHRAHARGRRPIRCTKYTFGGSGVTLKPWSQALQKTFRLIPTRGL